MISQGGDGQIHITVVGRRILVGEMAIHLAAETSHLAPEAVDFLLLQGEQRLTEECDLAFGRRRRRDNRRRSGRGSRALRLVQGA